MNRAGYLRILGAVLILSGTAACGTPQRVAEAVVAPSQPQLNSNATSIVFLDLLAGNYDDALANAERVLEKNPNDAYALLAAAIVHQNAGRYELARRHYHALLQLGEPVLSQNALTVRAWSNLSPYTFGDVVRTNMARLSSDQEFQAWLAAEKGGGVDEAVSLSDENVISRFVFLKKLRDMKMIDPGEYSGRRSVNLSGLLPLTSPHSSARMAAPMPSVESLLTRLRSLDESLRESAISSQAYIAERSATLDAVLPAAPMILATPSMPPQGVLEAAAMVRRLERLTAMGLIGEAEMEREKTAIEDAIRTAQSR